MKTTKKNQIKIFCEKYAEDSNILLRGISAILNSNWGLGIIIAALSAWTGGILYV